jgi:hypothetical protein
MTAADASDLDGRYAGKHSIDKNGFDPLYACRVGAKSAFADQDCHGHCVDSQDFGPLTGNNLQQRIDRWRFDCREYSGVDRGHCARMAAGEGYQVLVRLFGFPELLAQSSNRAVLEMNQLSHVKIVTAAVVNVPSAAAPCLGPYPIDCPVASQSFRKAAKPASVSGCLNSWWMILGGAVMTSAPIFAASTTCIGLRTDATKIWVS